MQIQRKIKSLASVKQYTPIIIVILFVSILGIITLHPGSAAIAGIATEPEDAAVGAPASIVTDTAASGGKAIKFGAATSNDTTPPSVTLTADPTSIALGASTTLTATATDNVAVTKVEFRDSTSSVIATDTTEPFSYKWSPKTTGTKTPTAKAYDAAGNSTVSAAVNVSVESPTSDVEAGVKYGWGTPIQVENMDDLTNFNLYNTGTTSDWGLKRPANVSLSGGIMTINAKSDGTTGGMSHDTGKLHGRWETRMQAGGTEGCWRPVLLLWRESGTTAEVDYSESAGSWAGTRFFLHYSGGQTSGSVALDATQWHNYAVEWTSTSVKGYVDGVQFFSDTTASHIPTVTMHQTIQLDSSVKSTPCSINSYMKVDWMKVYN